MGRGRVCHHLVFDSCTPIAKSILQETETEILPLCGYRYSDSDLARLKDIDWYVCPLLLLVIFPLQNVILRYSSSQLQGLVPVLALCSSPLEQLVRGSPLFSP